MTKCLLCGGELKFGMLGKGHINYDRCKRCALMQQPEPMEAAYDKAYFEGYDNEDVRAGALNDSRQILAEAQSYVDRKSVYEIGSGAGHFADAAEELGWDYGGCDVSPDAPTVKKGQADLLAWPPEQAYTTDAPLVVLVHTFEHFEVPSLACDALEFLVQPGNVLFIRTPNAGNIKERPGWFHFWPDHPVLYESRHLVSLLGAYGFYCFRAQGVNNNDDLHLWFVRQ